MELVENLVPNQGRENDLQDFLSRNLALLLKVYWVNTKTVPCISMTVFSSFFLLSIST
jgi:hypothetical protein